jgi:tripeptide aminopeptidase
MNNRLVNLFTDLVSIDSPTGEENQVAEYIVSYLKDKVDFVEKDQHGNVFARLNGEGEPLLFAAHMDTVEPGRGIKPQVKNGYITSDGTTILGGDNKIAVAGILETVNQLKEQSFIHRPLEMLFTYSEEVGSYGAINFDYSQLKAKTGCCFDRTAPVGTIVTGSPFYDRFDLHITGKAAHASLPDEAVNVLPIFNEILNKITLGKVDEDTVFNIGVVKCGYVRNTIPGEIDIQGEIRSFVEKKIDATGNTFKNTIGKIIPTYKASYTIDFVRENPGYKLTSKEAISFLDFLEEKVKKIGRLAPRNVAWGVSDANIFNTKGLIMVNMGDGGEMAHEKTERIKIQEFETLINLMVEIIKI